MSTVQEGSHIRLDGSSLYDIVNISRAFCYPIHHFLLSGGCVQGEQLCLNLQLYIQAK